MAKLLGIDIGPSVVRTALVRMSYRRVTVEALGEAPIAQEGGVEAAIKAAVGTVRPDGIAVALPGTKAYYRRLDLPAAAAKELENVLGFELESTVPFDMEGAVFDHRVLASKTGVAPDHIALFAAMARIEDVEEQIVITKAAIGREPDFVASGGLPLASLVGVMPDLAGDGEGGPVAILELAETTSEMVVMVGGELQFSRTVSRGFRGLPQTAAHLARELRQTLSAWRALGGDPIQKLFLVGGGAAVQGAHVYLSSELGLSVLPLPEPKLEGLTVEQREQIPLFAKALSLALGQDAKTRTLNLRQGSLEAARSYPFLREKIPLLSGLAAVIVVSFGFSLIAEMRSLDAERAGLEARLSTVTEEVFGEATIDPYQARELLEKGPGDDDDPMPGADGFDVMVAFSEAVPQGVLHDVAEFDVSSNAAGQMRVTIQGTVPLESDAQKTAEQIASSLEAHKCFRDVKVTGTTQFNKERQKYTLEFEVSCKDKAKKKKPKKEGDDQ